MAAEGFICSKCNKELELENVNLEYLGYRITHPFLTCPTCKIIYIPEEVVLDKIHQVERQLEDK